MTPNLDLVFDPPVDAEPESAAPPVALPVGSSREVWRIGSSVVINGELSATTDVSIDGRFEGRLNIFNQRLSTGASSDVTADVTAGAVVIRGRFCGNITASEQVTVTRTAIVMGSIRAPRVELHPNAAVQGHIDTSSPVEN